MARYPFTIEPGDWLITRPRSLDEKKPPPVCREFLWGHLEPRILRESEKEADIWKKKTSTLIATLPYNYVFGPVYRVSFHCEDGIWQLMVLVNSICSEVLGGELLVWVTVSHGTTQWARWRAHTGDPALEENHPKPPEPDRSFARSDLGLCQAALPEGLLGDGKMGSSHGKKTFPSSAFS